MSEARDELDAWCAFDRDAVVVPEDRASIDATRPVRALILELFRDGVSRDFFQACTTLGREIAIAGGSPAFAAATLEGALNALNGGAGGDGLPAARGAVIEGFVAASLEHAAEEALAAWEFPHCAVTTFEGEATFAAGLPTDDDEIATAWAGRVAQSAARAGFRRAVVSGRDPARTALCEALDLAGIEIAEDTATRRKWTWLPWRRRERPR